MSNQPTTDTTAYLVRSDDEPQWGLLIDTGDVDWASCQTITDDRAQALLGGDDDATEVHEGIDRFGPDIVDAWQLSFIPEVYEPVDRVDPTPCPDERIETDAAQAVNCGGGIWHITLDEATWLQEQMSHCTRTAEDAPLGDGEGVEIEGHHWAVAADAAWTMIVDRDADLDVLCQVLHDGRTENVQVHAS